MKKIKRQIKNLPLPYLLYAGLTTILIPFKFGAATFILLSGWNILTIITLQTTKSLKQKRAILILGVLYPIVETSIKFIIFRNIIPYSYIWINSIEHGLFAVVTTSLLTMSTINSKFIKSRFIEVIFAISVFNLIGILNEILEFSIRYTNKLEKIGYYYDTLRDLIINLVMSTIAGIIIALVYQHFCRNGNDNQNTN